ncbi:tRNA 2-selenouridine(34) synthase MnmH [Planomicrobium chinense]|uniref:tRNA 2-selenouridine(34) synthase MnmH n=1 Tax=Planococcus chinensis TaxID=272917 RepID=UPI001CC4FBD9|nr:tRNA 2-selenouridine(34) synthase MnmH [Planococcus chinensis]MBZ5199666.1 tRNA 2-selenouridine(34) synthase MnmH [Planococcus chinensis]
MYSNINVEQLIPVIENGTKTLIDVRSPSEYKNFSIPGSINIPFFDDAERAEVGTLYKQVSIDAAKERGLEIISAKLPEFIRSFKKIEGDKVVFCWRGGMRSKTTATLLSLMNIHVSRLEEGIRAYRKWVVAELEVMQAPEKAFVLNGYTGAGKTRILKALEKEGYPVIDFEGMANHKGSIFGQIGLEPHNQKVFDSLLVHQLRALKDAPYVLFEAESHRIGKVVIPPFLFDLKNSSQQLIVDMPMEERVKEILLDYRPTEHQSECMEAFQLIKSRIHVPVAKQIEEDLESGDFASAIQLLLEHYYDSRYKHTGLQYPDSQKQFLPVGNIEEAIQSVKDNLPQLSGKNKQMQPSK